jgi:hypothetical protein
MAPLISNARRKTMPTTQDATLSLFELPQEALRPLLSGLRLVNGAADALFYDVGVLCDQLAKDGYEVKTFGKKHKLGARREPSPAEAVTKHVLNLSAQTDPEGVILVIDANRPPYVTRHADVNEFLARQRARRASTDRKVATVSVTGVGSSALGSAAFAWNLSSALDEPVAAIVPGYGLADIVPQALSGWFGFGVQDELRRAGQEWINLMAPMFATAGRRLVMSVPERAERDLPNDALPFRAGSPESDILHAILLEDEAIVRVCGHSRGALCIENALRSLRKARVERIEVITFGCAITEETGANYRQTMGWMDGLGWLNSWGNLPERLIDAWHSTNTFLPATMPVAKLAREARTRSCACARLIEDKRLRQRQEAAGGEREAQASME